MHPNRYRLVCQGSFDDVKIKVYEDSYHEDYIYVIGDEFPGSSVHGYDSAGVAYDEAVHEIIRRDTPKHHH